MRPTLLILLLSIAPTATLMAQVPPAGTAVPQGSDPTATPAEIDKATPARSTLGRERMNRPPVATAIQTDSAFVAKAGKASATEISASKLAMSKSKDERVREFANHMIRDHNELSRKLSAITRAEKMENPPDQADEEVMALLRSLDGDAFDQAYIQRVAIDGHNQVLEAFTTEAQRGGSPALKKTAEEALPVIKKHLEMAKRLKN